MDEEEKKRLKEQMAQVRAQVDAQSQPQQVIDLDEEQEPMTMEGARKSREETGEHPMNYFVRKAVEKLGLKKSQAAEAAGQSIKMSPERERQLNDARNRVVASVAKSGNPLAAPVVLGSMIGAWGQNKERQLRMEADERKRKEIEQKALDEQIAIYKKAIENSKGKKK